MEVHGRGYPVVGVLIRAWMAVLDRCLAIVALTSELLALVLLAVAFRYAGERCPDE
jgi:hypothetical protein